MRFKGELRDLEIVKGIGEKLGYGNCIQYLQNAWADSLVEKWKMSKEVAALSAGMCKEDIEVYKKHGSDWLKKEG